MPALSRAPARSIARRGWFQAVLLLVCACGDHTTAPATLGTIRVTTATSGVNLDPDGYTVTIQNGYLEEPPSAPVDIDGRVDFPDLEPGVYTVFLNGVQFTCTSTTNELPIGDIYAFTDVAAGGTSDVTFELTCTPPPAGRLVFASDRDDGEFHIYTIKADGSGLTRLTEQPGGQPAWSPDGSRIAWSAGDIWVMNADGSGQVNLTNGVGGNSAPSWSPDGARLVFTSNRESDEDHLYTMNSDGSDVRRLVEGFIFDGRAAWSPVGDQIAFDGFREDASGIFSIRSDGTGLVQLTTEVLYEDSPAWSPDGGRIAFHRIDRKNYDGDIFLMNADGTGLTRLALDGTDPTWSPDGTKIAYDRDDTCDIYFINVDGTQATNFTQTGFTRPGAPVCELDPDWAP